MKNGILSAFFVALAVVFSYPAVAAEPSVGLAVYTSGVKDRQPVDQFTALPKDLTRVYFYTELNNLAGKTVTHQWQQGGKTVLEVPFDVKAARWRVWSSKEIHPGMSGEWTVVVVDKRGKELHRATLAAGQ